MYDWNHNGKHDAFDDAMFMALLEDDLERHPPGKKHTNKRYSVAETTWADIGCFAYVLFFIA